ncbi:thioredoxin domain-containing protein [Actinoplanes sp. L3-i22]|uniref:DsbA family protein n=1 Tax=Actinoplanes sp. L3-i22 TaxID=2836373 RepID=UPI001C765C57|nr:thioredoxin domain-containing protein [Actinoplanes sp. L3-i22]BCY05960.1 membrane protein [Actinoplanes sp. L3-i22]
MSKGSRDRAELARRIVQQQKAADKRRTITLWTSVAVVVVLVIAGFIGYATLSKQNSDSTGALVTPSVAVDDGTAFAVGSGPVTVDVYEDFMCPICNHFEQQSGATLKTYRTANKITLRYHPVSILDRASNGTEYSTRSAGAAAAAAEEGKFTELHDVLYANQPAENSDGLSNAKIIELAKSVGLTSDKFASAVNAGTYKAWATKVTETFSSRGYTGTPTIVINGTQLVGPNDTLPTDALLIQTLDKAAG